jgi:hypothetical protein
MVAGHHSAVTIECLIADWGGFLIVRYPQILATKGVGRLQLTMRMVSTFQEVGPGRATAKAFEPMHPIYSTSDNFPKKVKILLMPSILAYVLHG